MTQHATRYEQDAAVQGETLGQTLENSVNRSGGKPFVQGFVDKVTQQSHRTLQQLMMQLFWACIVQWSKAGSYHDARNEATVKLCKQIVEAVGEEQYFPYV